MSRSKSSWKIKSTDFGARTDNKKWARQKSCRRVHFCRLENIFQGQLLRLVEQLNQGNQPGVGGGIFPLLPAIQKFHHLPEGGVNGIGVGVAEGNVKVSVLGLPLLRGGAGELIGLVPGVVLRLGLGQGQQAGELLGKAPQHMPIVQSGGEHRTQDGQGDPGSFHYRASFSTR